MERIQDLCVATKQDALGILCIINWKNFNVECVILAPTTMLEQRSKRRIKTDKRDAEIIARSLAQHNYSPVHIPTETDNQTKEFIRMRDDHKAELKRSNNRSFLSVYVRVISMMEVVTGQQNMEMAEIIKTSRGFTKRSWMNIC